MKTWLVIKPLVACPAELVVAVVTGNDVALINLLDFLTAVWAILRLAAPCSRFAFTVCTPVTWSMGLVATHKADCKPTCTDHRLLNRFLPVQVHSTLWSLTPPSIRIAVNLEQTTVVHQLAPGCNAHRFVQILTLE